MDAQGLGRYLRQAREARELTLADAEQALRIRQRVLEQFEFGDFAIPNLTAIQLRGFLRNYANYLGLDAERVMQYYDAALSGAPPRRTSLIGGARKPGKKAGRKKSIRETDTIPAMPPPVTIAPRAARSTPRPTDTPPGLPAVRIDPRESAPLSPPGTLTPGRDGDRGGLLTTITRLLVAAAALAVIAFVLVQMLDLGNQPTEDPILSGVLGQLPPTLTFTAPAPTFTPRPATQIAVVPNASTWSGEGLQVIVQMEQRSWLNVTVDGQPVFTSDARPGERLEYVAATEILLTATNAEALNITFNGQRQPSFGMRGQRVDITFRIGGITVQTGPGFDPTPIESPTPLPTPTDPAGALIAQLTPPATAVLTVDPAAALAPIDAGVPTAELPTLEPPTPDFVPITVTPSPDPALLGAAPTVPPSPTPLGIIPTATPGSVEAVQPADPAAIDFAATATFLGQSAPTTEPASGVSATSATSATSVTPDTSVAPVTSVTPDPGLLIPPSATPLPPTATVTPSLTFTPSPSPTRTPSPTVTLTPTRTPSPTRTPLPPGLLPPRQPAISPTPTKTAP